MNENDLEKDHKPFLKQFFVGAAIGLIASGIIGLISYPWGNPHFEGGAGYHMLFILILTPCLVLGVGVFTILVCYVIEKMKMKMKKLH